MNFQWNETKNRANIRKHGFHFAEAEEMFRGALLVRPDTRDHYEERRWIGIGMIHSRVAFVAFVELLDDTIRVISVRKANHEEREEYEKTIKNGLETH
jgi:uncharacterized DUF497 family protein